MVPAEESEAEDDMRLRRWKGAVVRNRAEGGVERNECARVWERSECVQRPSVSSVVFGENG